MDRSLIPRSIADFDVFITKTNAYLILGTPTNAVRFNWTAANLTAWQAFKNQWAPLHIQYADKKGQRTVVITEQLYVIIANVIAYAKTNKLIELIKATLTLSVMDCETFNISVSNAAPNTGNGTHINTQAAATARTIAPTADLVYPKLKPEGGGVVRCKCFPLVAQSGRAHKLAGFDLVEYSWAVFAAGTANLPTDANDARLVMAHISHASFLLATGTNNANKILVVFFRWAKSKHPELDGPWNGPFSTPVL